MVCVSVYYTCHTVYEGRKERTWASHRADGRPLERAGAPSPAKRGRAGEGVLTASQDEPDESGKRTPRQARRSRREREEQGTYGSRAAEERSVSGSGLSR